MAADELTDWTPGDPLLASHLQQPVGLLRKMLGRPGGNVPRLTTVQGAFTFVVTLGQIVDTGPNGEADFTNEQYWVKPQFISSEVGPADAITLDDITPPDEFADDGSSSSESNVKAVTNLAELQDGSHRLKVDRYVWFFAVSDGADDPVEHLLMSENACATCNPAATTTTTLGSDVEGAEAADTTAFDFTTGAGTNTGTLELWMTSRVGYFESGDEKLYGYARKLTFACVGGNLVFQKASAETVYVIDVPEDCTTP